MYLLCLFRKAFFCWLHKKIIFYDFPALTVWIIQLCMLSFLQEQTILRKLFEIRKDICVFCWVSAFQDSAESIDDCKCYSGQR